MKWPLMSRREHDRQVAELRAEFATREREFRHRLFALRDNMKEAKRRTQMHRSIDNEAAYHILDQAIIRDMEKDLGPQRETS